LNATMMASLVQEHERAAGAWHAEWPTIVDALQATGAALAAMRGVIAELVVDPVRMRANLDATRGAIYAERAVLGASVTLPRSRARALVEDALARLRAAAGPTFGDVVRAMPELAAALSADDLRTLDDPHACLGAAEALRQRLLTSVEPK
jgi:3-carboxy-cis,cis-muconate cycloisomerase